MTKFLSLFISKLSPGLAILMLGLAPVQTWAAACCGGGFALPSLISGDDRAQISLNFAHSELRTQVDGTGVWEDREIPDINQSLRFESAFLLSDLWQMGFSLPLSQRRRGSREGSGLGDISLNLGYEFISDWDYHPWRPKALLFFQLTTPTGGSVYDDRSLYGLEAQGRGFWSLGIGTLLTKNRGPWDAFVLFDVHRSLERNARSGSKDRQLIPGWGGNLGFGVGYNSAEWRVGPSLTWSYEDPIESRGELTERGQLQRWATASLNVSYLAHEDWAASLGYQDQSLFGAPLNTSLSRGLSFFVQHKWPR